MCYYVLYITSNVGSFTKSLVFINKFWPLKSKHPPTHMLGDVQKSICDCLAVLGG